MGGSPGLDRRFRLLLSAQISSDAGTAIATIALPLVAVITLNASAFQVGTLATCEAFPLFLSAIFASWIEARSEKKVMVLCDLGRAVVQAGLAIALVSHALTFALMCCAALALGLFTAPSILASQSMLPAIVPPDALLRANASLDASGWFGTVAGPAAGAILIRLLGYAGAFFADAASYLASALGVWAISYRPPERSSAERSVTRSFADGLRFVGSHGPLRGLVLANIWANFALTFCIPVEAIFLLRSLHATVTDYGLLIGLPALGGLAASFLTRRLTSAPGQIVRWSAAGRGVAQCALPFAWASSSGLYWAGAALTVVMFFAGIYNSAQTTFRQQITPPELRVRVHAFARTVMGGSRLAGPLCGGALAVALGTRATLLAGGLLVLVPPLVIRVTRPGRRHATGEDSPGVARANADPGGARLS
jgi:MFS family permease